MFEHYLENQRPDTKRQKILSATMAVATVGTAISLVGVWVGGKLAVTTVDPPTISFIMVQMNQEEAPPPPPPPPPPAGDDSGEEEEEEELPEEEEPIEDEIQQPKEVSDKIPDSKPGGKKGSRIPGGVKGGVPGGVPGGVIGGVVGGVVGGGVRSQAKTQQAAKKPLSAVMANKVYQPPKPAKQLLQTPTGRFGKKPGSVIATFCISPSGKVIQVRKKRGFPGDPAIDKIMIDWLKKFRFRPFKVGGKAQKICSEYKMNVSFKTAG